MTYTKEEKVQIAETIVSQMGGHLKAFVGATNLMALDSGLQFDFKGSRSVNRIRIVLNDLDLYDVTFYKIPPVPKFGAKNAGDYIERLKLAQEPIETIEGVYGDMLMDVFKNHTGLSLHF